MNSLIFGPPCRCPRRLLQTTAARRIIGVWRHDVIESATAVAAAASAAASYWHSLSQRVSSSARRSACWRIVNETALQRVNRRRCRRRPDRVANVENYTPAPGKYNTW